MTAWTRATRDSSVKLTSMNVQARYRRAIMKVMYSTVALIIMVKLVMHITHALMTWLW